jgi:hypothetical protein
MFPAGTLISVALSSCIAQSVESFEPLERRFGMDGSTQAWLSTYHRLMVNHASPYDVSDADLLVLAGHVVNETAPQPGAILTAIEDVLSVERSPMETVLDRLPQDYFWRDEVRRRLVALALDPKTAAPDRPVLARAFVRLSLQERSASAGLGWGGIQRELTQKPQLRTLLGLDQQAWEQLDAELKQPGTSADPGHRLHSELVLDRVNPLMDQYRADGTLDERQMIAQFRDAVRHAVEFENDTSSAWKFCNTAWRLACLARHAKAAESLETMKRVCDEARLEVRREVIRRLLAQIMALEGPLPETGGARRMPHFQQLKPAP